MGGMSGGGADMLGMGSTMEEVVSTISSIISSTSSSSSSNVFSMKNPALGGRDMLTVGSITSEGVMLISGSIDVIEGSGSTGEDGMTTGDDIGRPGVTGMEEDSIGGPGVTGIEDDSVGAIVGVLAGGSGIGVVGSQMTVQELLTSSMKDAWEQATSDNTRRTSDRCIFSTFERLQNEQG